MSLENIAKLRANFNNITEQKLTCKLQVMDISGNSWNFYFKNGCLLWAMASQHRIRRLYRLTNKYSPNIDFDKIKLREQEITELWGYLLISILNRRGEINDECSINILQEIIYEILFDCFLANNKISKIKSIFETSANQIGSILRSPLFKQPIVCIDINTVATQAENEYKRWLKAGIANLSPNLAPVIKDSKKLQQMVDANIYSKLSVLIDGKKTLRDLAIVTKQELLTLTCSLLPYVKNQSLKLEYIEDKQLASIYFSTEQNAINAERTKNDPNRDYVQESDLFLVVCIDDNPRICQQMAQVLNPAGYRLISVNESVKALGVLLENKPDLIFLDLIMPVANGYEICAQLRRVKSFQNTPIIIMTSSDRVINRVRAKVVKASEFLTKPVQPEIVIATVQKHLTFRQNKQIQLDTGLNASPKLKLS